MLDHRACRRARHNELQHTQGSLTLASRWPTASLTKPTTEDPAKSRERRHAAHSGRSSPAGIAVKCRKIFGQVSQELLSTRQESAMQSPDAPTSREKSGLDGLTRRVRDRITNSGSKGTKMAKNSTSSITNRHLQKVVDVETVLRRAARLRLTDKLRIVEQALTLLEGFYVHRPLKESMHGINPLQKLRLLQFRLRSADEGSRLDDLAFHKEVTEIFTSLRDLHTNYLLPLPFSRMVAFLPFKIEDYWLGTGRARQRRYLVSHFISGFRHDTLKPGVEMLTWNGMAIDRAVARISDLHAGSNREARHARGVVGLTLRPLVTALPPDEQWVILGYRDLLGKLQELRQDWLIFAPPEEPEEVDARGGATARATAIALDLESDMARRADKVLYAPSVIDARRRRRRRRKGWERALGTLGRDFEHPNLEHPDLHHPNLEHPDLDHPNLEHPDLDHPNLEHPRLEHPNLGQPNIDHPTLDHPNLPHPRLEHPRLPHPNARTAPASVALAERLPLVEGGLASRGSVQDGFVTSNLPDIFEARAVRFSEELSFGYLRIRTFNVPAAGPFVEEFVRLAALLPQHGLVLDVRDNGGGLITAGERVLQVLTPRRIQPESVQLINTPLTLELCNRNSGPDRRLSGLDLSPWKDSVRSAVQTGATFSRGFPITDPRAANALGQTYHGPVVLITNARCYSTTDIFAAGFQDHDIGPILGVHGNTGAGGANVWTHELLQYLSSSERQDDSPLEPLPRGASMRVAIRRNIRVGRQAGTPLEDLGVRPNYRHYTTRDDLLNRNVDLINAACRLLKRRQREARSLGLTLVQVQSEQYELKAETKRIDRLDVYVDAVPMLSVNVRRNQADIQVPASDRELRLDVKGFYQRRLVAAKRVYIAPV